MLNELGELTSIVTPNDFIGLVKLVILVISIGIFVRIMRWLL